MAAIPAWVDDSNVALLTDLYELTMLQAYVEEDMHAEAVFSLFVRRLPQQRNYLLACGLDSVLDYLEKLTFTADSIDYLASLNRFSDRFLAWLADFRFQGDVFGVPEGTPVFANEPILEVQASIPQAQLIETFVMNQIHLQTVLASKAARVMTAAQGRNVIDFGPRRIHGTDAALKAARAFHIAGLTATANVLAGKIYGVPLAGTMAHSFIQACDTELDALRAFTRLYPHTVLLVDTYDTLAGVKKVIALARELGEDFHVQAVRLDSGDMADLAFKARALLDAAGLQTVEIFASGGLDEDRIAALVAQGAPINGFGVGSALGVSQDAPVLDIAYKLCAYAGRGRLKLSAGKPILPGRKQVFRVEDTGSAKYDVIARDGENLPGRPLLQPVMRGGQRLPQGQINLSAIRQYAHEQLSRLPDAIQALPPATPPYPVQVSQELQAYQALVAREVSSIRQ